MQRGVVIRRSRSARAAALSQWLPAVLRPASSGPLRYWQDRTRLAVKAALAAAAAWALAKYAAGQADPYFAPIAAVLGVYPTVVRSLREVVTYVAGFLLGAAIAVPLAVGLGPSIAGIAIVVLAGMLISGWRRLGDQSAQVTFTALFVLLLGGDQPLHYLTHRAVDVGIGLATGLAVNLLAFPPLQLRPAEHAIGQWGENIAAALGDLATAAASPDSSGRFWPRDDRELTAAAERARAAARRARESLRWNPRAAVPQSVPRPDGAVIDALDVLTARTRAAARSLLDGPERADPKPFPSAFGRQYAEVLRALADPVCQLADLRAPWPEHHLADARDRQRQLECLVGKLPADNDRSVAVRHLVRLTADMIQELAGDSSPGN
jgi:Fusaric acid resistance protein-like